MLAPPANATETCRIDAATGRLICSESGGGTPTPRDEKPDPNPLPESGKRYIYTATDPVIGACHYWSNTPGGLDAWDPANDGTVIAIATKLPVCPAPPTPDPVARAWSIYRSWDLDPPAPYVTPESGGVTGVPTQLDAVPPPQITHTEVMPDGRTLDVRARVWRLVVSWGDGSVTRHAPSSATGYPNGSASHIYALKTCTQMYRNDHPSGALCHPTASFYPIVATYEWTGEYSIGAGWMTLGSLPVAAPVLAYDVDEAVGIVAP